MSGAGAFNKSRQAYPGLRPFSLAEADLFFGREQHVRRLREKLLCHSFVAVVGTSGSGKSSLIRAGLLASLRDDQDVQWRVAGM
jgi:ABC-type phosphate/phosphonate transport system ATPase subunit